MDRITKLDDQLSALFKDFNVTAHELTMVDICNLTDETTIAQQDYPGIYRIDISTAGTELGAAEWIEALRTE